MHLCKSKEINLQYLYPELVDVLFKTTNQTVLRNIANCISHLRVDEYRESEFIDLLLNFIKDYENKVAVQVYSIYTLMQFMERYPELIPEVEDIINFHAEGKTIAYRVAMKRFRGQLMDN